VQGRHVPSVEKHLLSVKAGSSMIRIIKGKGGSAQQAFEEEFGVKLLFPSSKEDEYITIEGKSAESVARASDKIKAITDEAFNSRTLDYSHFVSLPLPIYPKLADKLLNFQSSILGGISSSKQVENVDTKSSSSSSSSSSTLEDLGIDKSIFIKPQTFHLTVLMLKLWNKDLVDAAAEVLQNVSSKVMDALDNRPVSIRLKGLSTMRGSLAKAYVLYAPVEEVGGKDRLMRACQVIIDEFVKAGLVPERDAQHKLKLHATVMNARYRKRNKGTRRNADSFDARNIVKQYGSEDWGEYVIRGAHLSQRFAFDENGYYHCCASIPFPKK
jgi:activating signal cointegrator complex subunit 1